MVHVMDTDEWTVAEVQEFADKANTFTDGVHARGEPWLDAMARLAPQVDVIFAVWREPSAKRGADFGIIKGAGKLKLLSQAKKGQALRMIHVRLLDREMADLHWLDFGDGRPQNPKAGHLLSEHMRGR